MSCPVLDRASNNTPCYLIFTLGAANPWEPETETITGFENKVSYPLFQHSLSGIPIATRRKWGQLFCYVLGLAFWFMFGLLQGHCWPSDYSLTLFRKGSRQCSELKENTTLYLLLRETQKWDMCMGLWGEHTRWRKWYGNGVLLVGSDRFQWKIQPERRRKDFEVFVNKAMNFFFLLKWRIISRFLLL